MPSPRAIDELLADLGPVAVLTDPDRVAPYVVPWRGTAGSAAAVVRPASTDEVRTLLGWARRHLVRVIPQGANTGLVGASTPPPGSDAVVLSTTRLRAEPRIDAADRSAVVDAGVTLSELNAAAGRHGLCLPIDLAADPTLGGMVATNTGGSRMVRHGDLRRWLLGVRAVLADADCTVVDELHTLRKHNVGPSMGHLLVGAGGALGVVTAVAVELAPVAADRACAWVTPCSTRSILDLLQLLERDHADDLSAFEVVSSTALDAASRVAHTRQPLAGRPLPPHVVLVEFEGRLGTEERLVAALDRADRTGSIADAVVLAPTSAWELRHSVTEGLSRLGTVVGVDVSVPRGELPALVEAAAAALDSAVPGARLADFGHWGDGGVHANVVFPEARFGRDPGPAAELVERARTVVLELVVDRFAGSFSAEHGVGPVNAAWWRSTASAGTARLLAELCRTADPLGILGHPALPYRGAMADPLRSRSVNSAAGSGREYR